MRSELGEGACTRKRRNVAVGSDLAKQGCCIAAAGPGCVEGLGVVLQALAVRTVPALDRRCRPFGALVSVTVVAGVGRPELCRNIGPGHPEAVIVPPVDHHVSALRHVARRAGQRWSDCLVLMMGAHGILVDSVALQAGAVRGSAELAAVRLVAVAAGDTGREHLALLER